MSDVIVEAEDGAVSTDDLQKMLENERAARQEALEERDRERNHRHRLERERDEVVTVARTETEKRYAAEMAAAKGGIDAASADADRAEDAYVAALEAGDHRAAAKAQRALAEATTRKTQAEAKAKWLETNKESLVRQSEPSRRHEASDEYERLVPNILPAEREWLKTRAQFINDERYQQMVFGASHLAVTQGHQRGSEGYFRRMEEILGEARSTEEAQEQRRPRQMSADVPPGRRGSDGQPPTGSRTINLTADEAETADFMFPDIPDRAERYRKYASNKAALRASGRL